MSENPNQHILSYLTYYVSHIEAPRYALMITGGWGSGKTWLIQRYTSSDEAHKYLYVSLYGAKSANDVAERIFAARHPFLTSKGAVIAGRLIKGLVKISTNIDINGDKKDDLLLRPEIPEVMDVAKKHPSTDDHILVFDDIERCVVTGDELWGFINQLVEHEGKKVILLSAENEMEGKNESYRRTKEKTIGMTLQVIPDAVGALDCMISEANDVCAKALKKHRGRALKLFEYSNCASLRVLRFAIRDFCRMFTEIPSILQEEPAVALRLLESALPLAFGIYSGELKPENIEPKISNLFSKNQNDDDSAQKIYRRYSGLSLPPSILSLSWWRGFFARGELEVDELTSECRRLAENSRPPDWLRLANFDQLSDSEFGELLEKTWRSLVSGELHTVGQILHVAATHMWALREKVVSPVRTLPLIVDAAKRAIDSVDHDSTREGVQQRICDGLPRSYAGFVYPANEMAEFQELVIYAIEVCKSSEQAVMRLGSRALLAELRRGGQAFAAALGIDSQDDWRLERAVPTGVLAEIDTEEFVKILLSLSYQDQIQVVKALRAEAVGGSQDWVERMTATLEQLAPEPSLQKYMLLVRLKRPAR